jgi:hypothetical protein
MKYYEIMELENNTPINNRDIGADFHICTEIDKERIESEILKRENNFYTTELTNLHKNNYELQYLDCDKPSVLIEDIQELTNKINEIFGGNLFDEGGIDCTLLNGYIGFELKDILEFVGADEEDIKEFIQYLRELEE